MLSDVNQVYHEKVKKLMKRCRQPRKLYQISKKLKELCKPFFDLDLFVATYT